MNAEELKQLKKGNEIFIRAKFVRVFDDGDVLFTHTNTSGDEEVVKTEEYTHSSNVILPSEVQPAPKYEPCRRFKEGDKVRVVENKGRKPGSSVGLATVKSDEDENKVLITIDGSGTWWVDAAYLELVTPVEELLPYSVGESSDYFSVDKGEEEICTFWKDSHPNAREGAEAECARLNAEYRKEQA